MKHFDFNNRQDVDDFEWFCSCVLNEFQRKAQKERRAFGNFLVEITAEHLGEELRQIIQFGEKEVISMTICFNRSIDFKKRTSGYYASVNAPALSDAEEWKLCGFIADVAADYWDEIICWGKTTA